MVYAASGVIQLTVGRLENNTTPGLVHRAAPQRWRIRVFTSQRRGEWEFRRCRQLCDPSIGADGLDRLNDTLEAEKLSQWVSPE